MYELIIIQLPNRCQYSNFVIGFVVGMRKNLVMNDDQNKFYSNCRLIFCFMLLYHGEYCCRIFYVCVSLSPPSSFFYSKVVITDTHMPKQHLQFYSAVPAWDCITHMLYHANNLHNNISCPCLRTLQLPLSFLWWLIQNPFTHMPSLKSTCCQVQRVVLLPFIAISR